MWKSIVLVISNLNLIIPFLMAAERRINSKIKERVVPGAAFIFVKMGNFFTTCIYIFKIILKTC